MFLYIALVLVVIILLFNIFLFLLNSKINRLEDNISVLFKKRLGIIPPLFDVSKDNVTKHSSVFEHALKLFKNNVLVYYKNQDFYEKIYTESLIHHELDFLFKIFNKNTKFTNNYKFVYLRDIAINTSFEIGNKMRIYKKIIKKYNNLLRINKLMLVGFFISLDIKREV